MEIAWKHDVFVVPPEVMASRLQWLSQSLLASVEEAGSVYRRSAALLRLRSTTVSANVGKLQALGFTLSQTKSMCESQRSMLGFHVTTNVQQEKWEFLTCLMQLTPSFIATRPHLLMSSLPKRLGPRWEFLQHLRDHGLLPYIDATEVTAPIVAFMESKIKRVYAVPLSSPLQLSYDQHFQAHWQLRWKFLRQDQQLSIQDIAKHPARCLANLFERHLSTSVGFSLPHCICLCWISTR